MANATFIGAFSGNTGTSASTTVSAVLTGVQEGDIVVAVVTAERSTATIGTPVTQASNSFSSDANAANTTMVYSFSNYTLQDGDAVAGTCAITSTVSGGLTRRCAIDALVFRGATSVGFVGGTYTENGTGVTTATAPSITPTEDDSTVVSLFASVSNVTPYIRTQSIDSPFTIEGNTGSSSASATNAYVTGSLHGLTGGNGASQNGATMNDTTSPTPTKFAWIAGTYAIGALVSLPWVFIDGIGTSDPGELSFIHIDGSDPLGLTDDLTFTLPNSITDGTEATYEVLIDWNGDGNFGDPGDDVTVRTLTSRYALSTQVGRNLPARSVDDVSPGEAQLGLNNTSRDYSPDNGSSPLAGLVGPGRDVLVRATFGSYTFGLFRGTLDDFVLKPSASARSVELTCIDGLGSLAQVDISTPLYQGVTTGQAIGYVLDAVGWPSARRDIDAGHTAIAWWWEDGNSALDALRKLVRAEGPPALLYINGDGYVVFRDRTHRYSRYRSRHSQAVFSSGGDEPQALQSGFIYDAGWKSLVNQVKISVPIRTCTGVPEKIWSTDTPFTLSDGESTQIVASSSDPFINAVAPEAGTDYTLSSGGILTCTLDRDSGASVRITVTATSGPATVLTMQLRASPVRVSTTGSIVSEDTASINTYGIRSYSHDVPWVNMNDGQAVAAIISTYYADRLPVITFSVSGNSTRMLHQLSRALSDQITVTEDESGINGSFFIERIGHEIRSGPVHVTTFTCEQAPAQITNPFRFDVAGQGFNQGLFAKEAIVVTPLFTFDDSGAGFDDGLFAN